MNFRLHIRLLLTLLLLPVQLLLGEMITVEVCDSYTDGWNGNILSIGGWSTDGPNQGVECDNHTIEFEDGHYLVTCGGGSWQEEVSWRIIDSEGNELLSGGAPFEEYICIGDIRCMECI